MTLLVTASQFSPDAREYVTRIEEMVVLIHGERLAELMMEHGVGVTPVTSYAVKKVGADYFRGE